MFPVLETNVFQAMDAAVILAAIILNPRAQQRRKQMVQPAALELPPTEMTGRNTNEWGVFHISEIVSEVLGFLLVLTPPSLTISLMQHMILGNGTTSL
jgi:hypothetical protein